MSPQLTISNKLMKPSMSRGVLLVTLCFNLMLSSDAFISHLSSYRSTMFDRNMNINAATLEIPRTKSVSTPKRKKTKIMVIEEQSNNGPSSTPPQRKKRKRRKVLLKRSQNNTCSSLSMESSSISSTSTKKRKKTPTKRISRSSTMPGFRDQRRGSDVAFDDGLDILRSKSGRDLSKNTNFIKTERERSKKKNQDQMYLQSDSVPLSLMQFVEEIHQVSRITPAEEVDLGTKTQEAMRLQRLYDNLKNELKRDPTDDEWCAAAGKFNMEALRQTIDEGAEAKNRLVTSNLRMVQRVVNLYIRNGLGSQYNAGDLMQEGVIVSLQFILL